MSLWKQPSRRPDSHRTSTFAISIIPLSISLVFISLVVKLTGTLWLKGHLSHLSTGQGYSYIGEDYPQNLPLPLSNVLLQFDNPRRAYRLDTAPGILEWAAQIPTTNHIKNGVVHLGEDRQPFTLGMMHQLKCLDLLREEVIRDRPDPQSIEIAPVTRHCLNYIRQMVMCRGDWELESFQFASHKNPIEWRGQYQCKDWETLWQFVKKNQGEHEKWLDTEGRERKIRRSFRESNDEIRRGKEEVEALEPHIRSAPKDNPHTRLLFRRFNWYLTNFLDYFTVIYEELPQDTRSKTLAGYETKAMQLFSMLVYVATNPHLRDNLSLNCARYCQDLFRFFHMHLYPHPDYPVHPSVARIDSVFPPPSSVRSVPNSAAFTLVQFHEETRCCAYGCPGSIQSAGNNFQRCSRCQIVSYCGRECQTRAWREEKFPHKKVCPIIRLLVDTGGGLDMFVAKPSPSFKIKLPGGPYALSGFVVQKWEAANVDRDLIQYMHDWGRWVTMHPDRNMPDGSWWNPGFEDYDELIQRMGGPSRFMNRLARWPSEEAQIRATLEQLPFCQQEFDRFTEPMPRGL